MGPDAERHGFIGFGPGEPCVLVVDLKTQHDEAYVCELVREAGRLVLVPEAESHLLSLEVERLRTENLLRAIDEHDVPIAVAAATAFHQIHPTTRTIVNRNDYDEALNIAASAISRLVTVYTIGTVTRKRVEIPVDLTTRAFARGATQLRSMDGSGVIEKLFVRRSDLLFAVSALKRAGVAFAFSLAAVATAPRGSEADQD